MDLRFAKDALSVQMHRASVQITISDFKFNGATPPEHNKKQTLRRKEKFNNSNIRTITTKNL